MYDTLRITVNRVHAGDFAGVPSLLCDTSEGIMHDTGDVWTAGKADNMRVKINQRGIEVEGSLPKFYLPDNTLTLTRDTVRLAVEKLSDMLHVDMKRGRITRLDVSTNFVMEHEPRTYYGVLGDCTYFTRSQEHDTTLYYRRNGKRTGKTLIFYDKTQEVQRRDGFIPDDFAGRNVLRYEMRLNNRVKEQLKEPTVTGAMLYDERFYRKAVQMWADSYGAIQKRRTMKINDMDEVKRMAEAYKIFCSIAFQYVPDEVVNGFMQGIKERSAIKSRSDISRLKKKITEVRNAIHVEQTEDLARELNGKIERILTNLQ